MKQLIAICAIGNDRTGLVYDLTRVVVECGGNVLESRMTALGNEFAMLLLVAGNWHTLAKLEGELAKLGEASGLTITVRRTEQRAPRVDMVSYTVDVVCLDQPGVLHTLSGFFSSRGIDVGDISTRTYNAAHTGAPDVLGVHGHPRADPDPHRRAARRVHGPLRPHESRRHPRTPEVLSPANSCPKRPSRSIARYPPSRCRERRQEMEAGGCRRQEPRRVLLSEGQHVGLHQGRRSLPRPAREVQEGRHRDRRRFAGQRRLPRQVHREVRLHVSAARRRRESACASSSTCGRKRACTAGSTWASNAARS